MKVCIIGCGAIGSLYAAHLAQLDGFEVWAYDTNQQHVDAIQRDGLQVRGERSLLANIKATSNSKDIPSCDLGIIATKTFHTDAAIKATAHVFNEGTVCCLQNGIVNENIVAENVARVASGVTLAGGHLSAPGVLTIDTLDTTWIGAFSGEQGPGVLEQLRDSLNSSGLNTELVSNIRGLKWTKLIFNSAANALCALSRLPFGEMVGQPALKEMMYGIADEGIRVAHAHEVELDSDPIALLDGAVTTAAQHIPSMLSDVLAERRTEIDALNGSIIQYGARKGINCPLNETVAALVNGLQHSYEHSD